MFGNMFTGEGPSALGMYIMQSAEDADRVINRYYELINSYGYDAAVDTMECALTECNVDITSLTDNDRLRILKEVNLV